MRALPAPARDFAERPYPGVRPRGSWRLTADGTVVPLERIADAWWDAAEGRSVDLTGRRLLLAYASNANPQKLATWFPGEILALEAEVHDWAAVWCAARRRSDGSVVATLTAWPGARERHVLLALTAEQVAAVDRWEGHPDVYVRQPFAGHAAAPGGPVLECEVYLGHPQVRPVLLLDGAPVRVFGPTARPHHQIDGCVPPRK